MSKPRVLIGLSGGVDSSVAAALLVENGCDVVGITLKLYDKDTVGFEPKGDACCSLNMVEDARSICAKLGIPHYVVDLKKQFEKIVIGDFVEQYRLGRTPNPCINCNRFIKWGEMLKTADVLECQFIATGHYARINREDGSARLLKAKDDSKDQSYALWGIRREYLEKTLLPNGDFTKFEIREKARQLGFRNAERAESQEICFVPDGHYSNLLKFKGGGSDSIKSGPIFDNSGRQIGTHKGYAHYTIGQRRGLGISAPRPLYVTRINAQENSIVVGEEDDLSATRFSVIGINYLTDPAKMPADVMVKIRYKHQESSASIEIISENEIQVFYNSPQRAITPGQSAVFYDGDQVLCGGIIDRIIN